jgi:hypothetical protein
MPDDDPKPTPKVAHIDFRNETFWFSGAVQGWSPGNITQVRLFDNFTFTPPTQDPLVLRGGVTLVDIIWAKKGQFWLSTVLNGSATYHSDSGLSGSPQMNNSVFWQPMKQITLSIGITLNGRLDKNGFDGNVQFANSMFQIVDSKAALGAALHF